MNKHIAAIFLCLSALNAQAGTPTGSHLMLFDLAHGQTAPRPEFIEESARHGVDVRLSAAELSSQVLAGARLLYIRAPSTAFSAPEKAAVEEFVSNGGSLLLVLDEERRTSLATTGVNDFLKAFDLQLTPDSEYLHNCGAIAKAGEINPADREIPFSGGRGVIGGTPFAFQLDATGNPAQPFAAWKALDNGARIIVMGEGMASAFLGTPDGARLGGVPRDGGRTKYWGKDSAAFMDDVFGWLLKL